MKTTTAVVVALAAAVSAPAMLEAVNGLGLGVLSYGDHLQFGLDQAPLVLALLALVVLAEVVTKWA